MTRLRPFICIHTFLLNQSHWLCWTWTLFFFWAMTQWDLCRTKRLPVLAVVVFTHLPLACRIIVRAKVKWNYSECVLWFSCAAGIRTANWRFFKTWWFWSGSWSNVFLMCMNSYCPVSIDRMNLSIDSFYFRKPRKNYTLLHLLQTRLYIVIYVLGLQLVNSKSPLPFWIVLASTKLHDTIQLERLWHSFHDPYQNLESEHTVVPDTQKKQYRLEHLKEKLSIRASVLLQWKDVHYCLSAAFYFERFRVGQNLLLERQTCETLQTLQHFPTNCCVFDQVCAISGQAALEPVFSPKTKHVYEKGYLGDKRTGRSHMM